MELNPAFETKVMAPGTDHDDLAPVMQAFEAFKDANDERLAQIEKRFAADVVTADMGLVTALGQQADAQAGVIKAEAESEHWLTANWRPILMLVLMGFLVWIGIILPLIDLAVGAPIPYQPRWNQLPAEFWNFLGIGMGGYIGGRSLEKVATQVIAARQK